MKWSKALGAWVPLEDWLAGRDTWPGYEAPFVILEDKRKQLVVGSWGLVPVWAKEPTFGAKFCYNARIEGKEGEDNGIENTSSYKNAIKKNQRCIVPVSGFHERHDKYWHRLTIDGQEILGLAGLWEPGYKTEKPTYTIITTQPNEAIATIHDRMPVILRPEDYDAWLNPDIPFSELRALCIPPYPSDGFMMQKRESTCRKLAAVEGWDKNSPAIPMTENR